MVCMTRPSHDALISITDRNCFQSLDRGSEIYYEFITKGNKWKFNG